MKKWRGKMRRAALFLMAGMLSLSCVLFNNSMMENVRAEDIEQVEEYSEDVETEESMLAATEETSVEKINLQMGEIRTLYYTAEKSNNIAGSWVSSSDSVKCLKESTTDKGDKVEYTCMISGSKEGAAAVRFLNHLGEERKKYEVTVSEFNYSVCPDEEFSIRVGAAENQTYTFKAKNATGNTAEVTQKLVTEETDSENGAFYKTYKLGIHVGGKWNLEVVGNKKPDEIAATYRISVGHTWKKEYTVDKAATCKEKGIESIHCSKCDAKDGATERELPLGEHKYGEWKVVTEATYIKEGLEERICEVCDKKEERSIPKKDKAISVVYQTHIQGFDWQEWKKDGEVSGTSGLSKRLEGIRIKLENQNYEGDIEYRTHVQSIGWEKDYVKNGKTSGTSGQSKRLEAIQIRLTGDMEKNYDIYYRVHAQSYGWLGWAKNDEIAGTAGYAKRLEAIEIRLVEKGGEAPESNVKEPYKHPFIKYQTHVQKYGWQGNVQDGAMSGTQGESKRLEGIKISLTNQEYEGDVQYRTHIQTYGWEENLKKNGEMSGTSGESKRLEAIEISLTGEMAEKYDIYYRVHAQKFGWMGWAKNGESAGTAGYAYRLEGIEIQLVQKGGKAPGKTENAFSDKNKK